MLVYHVSWLRAKAHLARWSEELRLVGCEMQWMVNWFQWKEEEWRKRLRDVISDERPPGLDSYCYKQIAMWGTLADQAHTKFCDVLGKQLFE